MTGNDWLDADAASEKKESDRIKRRDDASLYLVFEQNSAAKIILEQWVKLHVNVRQDVGASLQDFAARTAIRNFILGIREQISLAHNEGTLPNG